MSIKISNLGFGYTKEKILHHVDFSVHPGECLSIVGPNGTGKSTLIKCINGLLKPQKGQVMFDGQSVHQMSRSRIARHMGYIPQSSNGLFPLTVFDMVLLGRRPHLAWRSGQRDKLKVLAALNLLNIEHLALKSYNELSGGQQQKVVIARAIAQETDILLMDEATSSLDIKHQYEVMVMIRNLTRQKKIAAIIIVHDLNLAARFSDRMIMMADRTIVASGNPNSVLTSQNISKVFGIDVDIRSVNGKPLIVPMETVENQN